MVLIFGDQGGNAMELRETICQEQMALIINRKHMGTSWHRGNLGFLVKSAIAFFGEKLSTLPIIFHLFISSQKNALLKKQKKLLPPQIQ